MYVLVAWVHRTSVWMYVPERENLPLEHLYELRLRKSYFFNVKNPCGSVSVSSEEQSIKQKLI